MQWITVLQYHLRSAATLGIPEISQATSQSKDISKNLHVWVRPKSS